MRVFFSLEYDGLHYLNERRGAVILAGNHTGWLDTLAICAVCKRPLHFLAAKWVTKLPIIGSVTRALGGIAVVPGKGSQAIEEAARCLAKGEDVCIFPEGALSAEGKLAQFHSGVVKLQKESGCPIVPFAIYGGYEAWPYNRPLPRLHKMAIHFGVPLLKIDAKIGEATRELQDMVHFMKDSLERRYKSDQERQASFLSLLQAKSDVFSARPAVCIKTKDSWYELSYAELSRQAIRLASYLIELGITHGDRIAILSESHPNFAVCFFGAARSGATIVPLDVKLTNQELVRLINDCCPAVLFMSSHFIERFEEMKSSLSSLKHCFLTDKSSPDYPYLSIDNLLPAKTLPSEERSPEETALIIYTSGTTGSAKGVMISFANLIFQASQFEILTNPKEGDRFLSILPLNHLLELTEGFLGALHAGATIYYSHSLHPKEILDLMKEKRITSMIAVPLFYKTLRNGIEKEIAKGDAAQKFWWQCVSAVAKLLPSQSARRFLFAPLHKRLGGKLRILISGGAPLDLATAEFFDLIGIPLLQGYGLTETSPVITSNTPNANRVGSVGKPVPGVEIKIATSDSGSEEGEILTRGPHVMQGYFKREDLTQEVIDKDGWLHTGDLGKIDKDGYLFVTGRIKNLIVLGGGKKVHPEEVEEILATSVHIKEVCVMGSMAASGSKVGTEAVCAIVVANDVCKSKYKDSAEMEKMLTAELQTLSLQLASYKRPSRIVVSDTDLPKTATKKIKRNELLHLINNQKAR